jgi:hypothetical protein
MDIRYDVSLKTQTSSSNCVQTSTSQLLSFYGLNISPKEIENEVPVRTNKDDKPIGTLLPDIGVWLIKSRNLTPKIHVFDIQIIDRSWKSLSHNELLANMKTAKEKGISTAVTPRASMLIDSYVKYLEADGEINITKCTNDLLKRLLATGPVLAIISFNYMYDYPRARYNLDKKTYVPDAIDGKVTEHAIVITGYHDKTYFYNDPDDEHGGKHSTNEDILIGAICTAQINSNNYLLTIEK